MDGTLPGLNRRSISISPAAEQDRLSRTSTVVRQISSPKDKTDRQTDIVWVCGVGVCQLVGGRNELNRPDNSDG